ncbi:DUF488 domain-containing protein [Cellulosimicrobium sp. CUA-896]|uniref:DUF488 domain-containing protein n=1 Tax=Cellulosimicrobium sp. CUA-896 TaxID=1517881 RepID=UPI000968041A|nr:DUF488 family protein [Cellulosimicrobium sp. CUA-896]OLT54016.1 MarR family transcriptional regulator [Cellulosimicrobium sp. CUA-896]
MEVRTKRVYDDAAADDGFRVLVDRLWPRGVSKERARADLWLKEVAPSDELRRWFHHESPPFAEFARRYRAQLDDNPAVAELRHAVAGHAVVTLLYGARDATENQAVVLRDYLTGEAAGTAGAG